MSLSDPWTGVERANALLRALEAPKCKTHPRYQAKRRPRLPCEDCWRRYIHMHPRYT